MPRNAIYCCLRKLDTGDPKRCLTRLDTGKRGTKIGDRSLRLSFDEFMGPESVMFGDEDLICQPCFMKIRKIDPDLRRRKLPQKRCHSPSLELNRKLRSGWTNPVIVLPIMESGNGVNMTEESEQSDVSEHFMNGNSIVTTISGPQSQASQAISWSQMGSQVVSTDDVTGVAGDHLDEHFMGGDSIVTTISEPPSQAMSWNEMGSEVVNSDVMSIVDSQVSISQPSISHASTSQTSSDQSAFSQASASQSSVPPSSNPQLSASLPSFSQASASQSDSQMSSGSRGKYSGPILRGEVTFVLPGIRSVGKSQSCCFICKNKNGRCRIPNSALLDLYIKVKIMVPDQNRSCRKHLNEGIFTDEAIAEIDSTKENAEITGKQAANWIYNLTTRLNQKLSPVDFSVTSGLKDADYKLLTGISEKNFSELVSILKQNNLKDGTLVSVRNALGMFLVMLKLNISQRVNAFLFGVSQSTISEKIDAVSDVLLKKFVPLHLGYGHMDREELMTHMRPMYHTVLDRDRNDLILILDGTYLYVEKSSNYYLQRRSYSSHKHRNLFKPMIVVAPDGYIIEAEGLYFSDGLNNDAKILKHMWAQDNSIISILQTRDVLILDRGFRDVISIIEESGVDTYMPKCLDKGQKQFTTQDANESRKITKLRWIVEAINGLLKNVFSFFYDVIPAAYFEKLDKFLRIAVAILNAFFMPLFSETEHHEKIADMMKQQESNVNAVQEEVERLELHKKSVTNWLEVDEDSCLGFPSLSLEELELVTCGQYQLKMGKLYNIEHLHGKEGYKFSMHKDLEGLLRVRLQSRFSKRQIHMLWIKFQDWGHGVDAIKGYFCKCKAGARTIGCCSHVAAVLRYLCHDRFLAPEPRSDQARFFLDAAAALAEDSEDEDEEGEREMNEEEEDYFSVFNFGS